MDQRAGTQLRMTLTLPAVPQHELYPVRTCCHRGCPRCPWQTPLPLPRVPAQQTGGGISSKGWVLSQETQPCVLTLVNFAKNRKCLHHPLPGGSISHFLRNHGFICWSEPGSTAVCLRHVPPHWISPKLPVPFLVVTGMPNKQAEWRHLGLCQLLAKSKAGESNWWKYTYEKDAMRRN